MHSNCTLDSVANLLFRHMVIVGNVQKSPKASHLNDLDPSFEFCCQGPVDKMSVRISITLEARCSCPST